MKHFQEFTSAYIILYITLACPGTITHSLSPGLASRKAFKVNIMEQ